MQARIAHCRRCQADESGVDCMRDDPAYGGRCPVADDGPELLPTNETAVRLFREAEYSAVQVTARDERTYIYFRPSEAEALMRIHGVPPEDRDGMTRKLFALQDIANRVRPKPRPARPRSRR